MNIFVVMQKILIPTDFSDAARDALRYAAKYIDSGTADFYLLNAYDQPSNTDMLISIVDILKEESEKALKEEVEFCKKTLHIKEEKLHLISVLGSVEEAIQKALKTQNIDVVVMGTKGASGVKEILVGTNTVHVISKIDVPVIAVPKFNENISLDVIAIAIDNEGLANEHILDRVKEIAELNAANIVLLNVLKNDEEPFCFNVQQQNRLRKYFGRMDIECVALKGADVEKEINEFVWNNDIDMLVIFPRKMSLLQKLFGKKSISRKINFHSKVPVFSLG